MNSKIFILKDKIMRIKINLERYQTLIPGPQKSRFDKDLSMIFKEYDKLNNEEELNKMEKLAKTKLKSVERIYGEIKSETEKDSKRIDMFSKKEEEILDKMFENSISGFNSLSERYNEIKNSPAFNPSAVKRYQENYLQEKLMLEKAFETVMEENKNKNKNDEKFIMNDREFEMSKARDKDGKIQKAKLVEYIRDVMILNNLKDPDKQIAEMDIDSIVNKMQNKSNQNASTEKDKSVEDEYLADTTKTDELFNIFEKSRKEYTDLDKKKLEEQLDIIHQNVNLTNEEKAALIKKELKLAESEWNEKNLDGEIKSDIYGNFEFRFFRDKENELDKSKSEFPNSQYDLAQSSKDENNGVKTYVFRNGKLVEGKAKERTTVTYSNWCSGNLNPIDVRKHRELLDRQHFGGPLWQGIKVKSIFDEPGICIKPPGQEDNIPDIEVPQKEGKKEWVEIVR